MAVAEQMTIEQELEVIRKKNHGLLRPVDVVEYAADPETALHSQFTWDDSVAAGRYRIWQAREVIQVFVTVVRDDAPAVRAYVSLSQDRKEGGGGYRGIVDVMSDAEMRAALLAEARDEMNRFRRKYGGLAELASVFAEMDRVA